MTKKLFIKILNKYSKFSSFAIWDKNINDLEILFKNRSKLHTNFIFIGLNASASVKPFGNFHHIHRGGRDVWLAESLGKDLLFHGSYMTDIIKNDKAPRQNNVNLRSENILKNIKILKNEFKLVAVRNTILIAFGHMAHKILLENGIKSEMLKHYAWRGFKNKKQFFDEVRKLHNRLEK